MRIELILPRSQHGVQTTTLRAPLVEVIGFEPIQHGI